ncbi:hypothetical protein AWC04_13915 [Mycolicibacterium fallax]|uniref:SseB protein N-terminal domain-containing protein n=1 Tax=Mycolicibacterium fallax TaxID=1793 RepID=A0A1X1R8Q4_MYCFA|nr:hypothetical protein AWC04_13915 [Mycolicibacterium fallax]
MATVDNLNTLVDQVFTQRDEASRVALFRALASTEVFYPVSIEEIDGQRRVHVPLTQLEDGSHAFVVYVAKDHPDLTQQFGGATWPHTLEMANDTPLAQWMIVRGDSESWVPIERSEFCGLMRWLDAGDQRLDSLITEIADGSSDGASNRLREELRSSEELFARIEIRDGEPSVFVTGAAGDVGSLLQVFTSRRRSGLTYGGMTWESIVKVLAERPELNGVQIINDTDHWIVLDRADVA